METQSWAGVNCLPGGFSAVGGWAVGVGPWGLGCGGMGRQGNLLLWSLVVIRACPGPDCCGNTRLFFHTVTWVVFPCVERSVAAHGLKYGVKSSSLSPGGLVGSSEPFPESWHLTCAGVVPFAPSTSFYPLVTSYWCSWCQLQCHFTREDFSALSV